MIAVSRTNRGMVRPNNEDSILVREPDLYAIADGMGGADAGEVASYEAVHQLSRLDLKGLQRKEILPFLERSIQNINKKIWELSREKENFTGMGTTLTAVYLPSPHSAFVAHVGDSRIYVWQDGVLRQVTSDHSYVAELVRQKQMTQEEAETSSQKHMITRAIGVDPQVQVAYEVLQDGLLQLNYKQGDKLLAVAWVNPLDKESSFPADMTGKGKVVWGDAESLLPRSVTLMVLD